MKNEKKLIQIGTSRDLSDLKKYISEELSDLKSELILEMQKLNGYSRKKRLLLRLGMGGLAFLVLFGAAKTCKMSCNPFYSSVQQRYDKLEEACYEIENFLRLDYNLMLQKETNPIVRDSNIASRQLGDLIAEISATSLSKIKEVHEETDDEFDLDMLTNRYEILKNKVNEADKRYSSGWQYYSPSLRKQRDEQRRKIDKFLLIPIKYKFREK